MESLHVKRLADNKRLAPTTNCTTQVSIQAQPTTRLADNTIHTRIGLRVISLQGQVLSLVGIGIVSFKGSLYNIEPTRQDAAIQITWDITRPRDSYKTTYTNPDAETRIRKKDMTLL